jgi:DNA polymerase III subunit epsilon
VGDYFLMTGLPKKICFVDIETTGMSLKNDRVIEVGVLRIEDGKLIDTFNSLINPQTYIPPEIEILTGITKIDVESAPTFYQIKNDLKKILEDCVFVAHNVRFDFSFLKTEFKRFDLEFNPKHFCTVKLSRSLFPQHHHHNLDSIISRYGFINEKRHRAFDDAKVLWDFYQMVLKNFEEEKVLESINRGMKRPTVPLNLQMEYLEGLPDAPGVYIFYGENRLPLYIGKSVSIRKRVMNHFSSDHLSSIELKIAQQVKHVEHIVTSGELGALLKESFLIKKMQPIYNRKLRQSRKLIAVRSVTAKEGYFSVEFIDAGEIDVVNLDSIMGVFKSKRAAQTFLLNKCKEFELCEKFLGLDHTSGGCFQYRLGKCKGGCAGKELPVMYNFRFQQAFYENRLKKWPFATPVLIEEKGLIEGKSEAFVLDKWCLLGSVQQDGQDQNYELKKELEFDLDTYKILNSFLKSKKVHVRPINIEQLSFF